MGKELVELISNYYVVTGNSTVDVYILAIASFIGFVVVYKLTGEIFDSLDFYNSKLMSCVHWIIRIAIILILDWIVTQCYGFYKWVINLPIYIYIALSLISLAFISLKIVRKNFKNKSNNYSNVKSILNCPVYVNKPCDESDDLLDFSTYANSIENAVKDGANIIGVISDYGTGKSTLVEFLGKDKDIYAKNKTIINMWDCSKKKCKDNDEKISYMTKSFLFQMACGCKDIKNNKSYLAKHVNKRLSKNYGMLSFNGINRKVYQLILLATLILTFYYTLKSINSITMNYLLPIILFFAGLSIFFGIKDSSFTFSLWDSQGKREPEANDIFDI